MSAPGAPHAKSGAAFARFPLFVSLAGRLTVCVGGGRVAARRVAVLLDFGARVRLVAPALCPALAALAAGGTVEWRARPYRAGDLAGAFLALAATDARAVNHAVAVEAAARAVPVSVADCRAECTFYFPAVARGGGVVAGIVSAAGDSHRAAAAAARRVREALHDQTDSAGQPQKPPRRGAGAPGGRCHPPRPAARGD